MNIATIVGIISGFIVLSGAIINATGHASIFWNPQGVAIVLGGVVAATFICYPLKDVMRVFGACAKVLRREDLPIVHYIQEIHYLAQQAIASGTITLEKELKGVENFFLKNALRMVVDQYPREKIQQIMETTILNVQRTEMAEASIFRTMAKLAPAFGMVGTLIGLIVMFQNMDQDLQRVGPAMAVAMMTTFYGLLLAHLIFLPIAIKMERHAEERVALMSVIMEGVLLVSKRTPPELVMDELKAFIPPRKWTDIHPRTYKPAAKQKALANAS